MGFAGRFQDGSPSGHLYLMAVDVMEKSPDASLQRDYRASFVSSVNKSSAPLAARIIYCGAIFFRL